MTLVQIGFGIDEDSLAWIHITNDLITTVFNNQRFTGNDPLIPTLLRCSTTKNERADAVGISESQHPMTGNQRNGCIRTLHPLMQGSHRIKQLIRGEITTGDLRLNLRCQHIHQHFRIAGGIGMAPVNPEKILFKLVGVGEIAVVNKTDSIRRIHIKRLHLTFRSRSPTRGVTHVTNTGITQQFSHVAGSKCFPHASPFLMRMKRMAIHRDDAS
ncbi:MAG: Uncharacterised protein [Synechococcus sp. CC9902]|nr:MAG: Uncharacterised protein [Synechococcus sp. CC9902]